MISAMKRYITLKNIIEGGEIWTNERMGWKYRSVSGIFSRQD